MESSDDDSSDGVPIWYTKGPAAPEPEAQAQPTSQPAVCCEPDTGPVKNDAKEAPKRRVRRRRITATESEVREKSRPHPKKLATTPTAEQLDKKHKELLRRQYHLSIQKDALRQKQSIAGDQPKQPPLHTPKARPAYSVSPSHYRAEPQPMVSSNSSKSPDYLPPNPEPSQMRFFYDTKRMQWPSLSGGYKLLVEYVHSMPLTIPIMGLLLTLTMMPMHKAIEGHIEQMVTVFAVFFRLFVSLIGLSAGLVLLYKLGIRSREQHVIAAEIETEQQAENNSIPSTPAGVQAAPVPGAHPDTGKQEDVVAHLESQAQREYQERILQQQEYLQMQQDQLSERMEQQRRFQEQLRYQEQLRMQQYVKTPYFPSNPMYSPAQMQGHFPGNPPPSSQVHFTPVAECAPVYNTRSKTMRFPAPVGHAGPLTPDERLQFPSMVGQRVIVAPPTPPPQKLDPPLLTRGESFGTPACAIFHARENSTTPPLLDHIDEISVPDEDGAFKPYGPAPRRYTGLV